MTSTRALTLTLSALTLTTLPACNGGGETTTASSSSSSGGSESGGATDSSTGEPTTTPTTSDTGAADMCSDGERTTSEVCDGDDLDGKQCADVEPDKPAGELACAGDCKSFDASGCEAGGGDATVVLNEVTSQGATTGPFADKGDAIELFNNGDTMVDLTGWKLADDATFPVDKTYVFPPGSAIAPGEFLVLVAYDDVSATGELPFGISASNEETLTLADADSATVDELIFQGGDAVVSYCRLPDGTGAWQACDQTLGEANAAASQTCGDGKLDGTEICDGKELGGATCKSLGFSGGELGCTATCVLDPSGCETGQMVAINELESTDDQIELYNAGAVMVDISGWILTDDVVDANYDPDLDTEKLTWPAMSSLAPKEFLVVAKGMLPGQHPFGLGAGGDTVTLLKPDLSVVSVVTYGDGQAAVSYCRLPDGPTGAWQPDCVPTLGAKNMGL